MMNDICYKCGCEIQPGGRFCPHCGAPVPPVPQEAVRPQFPQSAMPPEPASPKGGINWKMVVAIAVIAVGSVCFYMVSKSNSEQRQWELCEQSADVADFETISMIFPTASTLPM